MEGEAVGAHHIEVHVPVERQAALLCAAVQRPDLHPGFTDCMHWCGGSEATLFMASAVLSVVRALVEHEPRDLRKHAGWLGRKARR